MRTQDLAFITTTNPRGSMQERTCLSPQKTTPLIEAKRPKFRGVHPDVKNNVTIKGVGTNILYTNLSINASAGTDFVLLDRGTRAIINMPTVVTAGNKLKKASFAILIKSQGKDMWSLFATTGSATKEPTTQQGLAFWSTAPWAYLGSRSSKPETGWWIDSAIDKDGLVPSHHIVSQSEMDMMNRELQATLTQLEKFNTPKVYADYLETTGVFRKHVDGIHTVIKGRADGFKTRLHNVPSGIMDVLHDSPLSFSIDSEGNIRIPLLRASEALHDGDTIAAEDNYRHLEAISAFRQDFTLLDRLSAKAAGNAASMHGRGKYGYIKMGDLRGAVGSDVASEFEEAVTKHVSRLQDENKLTDQNNRLTELLRVQITPALNALTQGDDYDYQNAGTELYSAALGKIDGDMLSIVDGIAHTLNKAYMGPKMFKALVDDTKARNGGDESSVAISNNTDNSPEWGVIVLRSTNSPKKVNILLPPTIRGSALNGIDRKRLIEEIGKDHLGRGWVTEAGDTDPRSMIVSKFIPHVWAMSRANRHLYKGTGKYDTAPSDNIFIKAGLRRDDDGYRNTGLGSNGELVLVAGDKLTDEGKKFLNNVDHFNEGSFPPRSSELDHMLNFLPPTSPALAARNTGMETTVVARNTMLRVNKDDPTYRKYDQHMNLITSALEKGAGIHEFGATLQQAFPDGISIRGSGVEGLYMFDGAGQLYKVSPRDPHDEAAWKPVPAQLFKSDGEYLQVLKALGQLADVGSGEVLLRTPRMEIAANRRVIGRDPLFADIKDMNRFNAWHASLMDKLALFAQSKDSPMLHAAEALTAFPTLSFDADNVYDEQTQSEIRSKLVSAAIERADSSQVDQLLARVYNSKETRDLAKAGYTKFANWVRASYQVEQFGARAGEVKVDTVLGRMALPEAQKVLHDHLMNHLRTVNDMDTGVFRHMMSNLPPELQGNRRHEFQDDNAVGWVGNRLFEHVIDPIYKWIQGEWDYLRSVVGRMQDIWNRPGHYFEKMSPKLLNAFYESLKLFFKKAAGAAIDVAFEDELKPSLKPDGTVRAYSYAGARRKAYDFMDNALDLRPLSGHESDLVGRLANTKSSVDRRENLKGATFKSHYDARFGQTPEDNQFIRDITGNAENGVEWRVPLTKGNHPKAMVKLNLNISNTKISGLDHFGVIEELHNAPASGVIVTGDGANASPDLHGWWVQNARRFMTTFKSRIPHDPDFPDSLAKHPKRVRMRIDRNNVVQLEMDFSMKDLFNNYGDVYHRIFNRRITSQDKRVVQESDRKLAIVRSLFFPRLKGAF